MVWRWKSILVYYRNASRPILRKRGWSVSCIHFYDQSIGKHLAELYTLDSLEARVEVLQSFPTDWLVWLTDCLEGGRWLKSRFRRCRAATEWKLRTHRRLKLNFTRSKTIVRAEESGVRSHRLLRFFLLALSWRTFEKKYTLGDHGH